jgi:PAS domain S-box-containing protein
MVVTNMLDRAQPYRGCFLRWAFFFLGFVGIFDPVLAQVPAPHHILEVTAAVPREFPPYYRVDESGRPEGFAIDLMGQIAELSDLKVHYVVEDDWSSVEHAVKSGRAQVIPNIGLSDLRRIWLDYTSPVETFSLSIFVREQTEDIKHFDDLIGRKVAAVRFNIGADLLNKRLKTGVVVLNDASQALLELLAGHVDAVVYPEPVFLKMAREAKLSHRIKIVGESLLEVKRAIGVAKGRPELLERMDRAVARFVGTKEYQQLLIKWFGEPPPIWTTQRVVLLSSGLALIVFLFVAGWRHVSLIGLNRKLTASISERKQAEEALKESECRYRAFFEEGPDGVVVLNPENGQFLEFNDQVCRQLGYSRGEFAHLALNEIEASETAEEIQAHIGKVVREGRDDFETMHRTKQGEIRHVHVTAQMIDAGGRSLYHCIWRDITERKRADEERKGLEERLQRAEKMEALGTLAGGVAHDLNNVLGIVVGYSELLLDELDESNSERSEAMEILKGGQRAAAIVQDLLTLARRGVQGRKVLNLNNIVIECQKSSEFAKVLHLHPNIQYKADFETDLLNILGSSVHLEKSFINLLSNAAEAMPNGGTLTVKTANCYLDRPISGYDQVREGDYAVLSVSDTGEGIPASNLKRIFEPFYTKKVMGRSGTGLGLAVVWGTVKDHLGYIDVESEQGKGTAFTLYFPVTREEVTPEQVSISASEYMNPSWLWMMSKSSATLPAPCLGSSGMRLRVFPVAKKLWSILERTPLIFWFWT